MKYRTLDAAGDYTFGLTPPQFYVNSPEGVAQAIRTRLLLEQGEWLLNTDEGTPYGTQVLGTNTLYTRDAAIKDRVLGTPGVKSILSYYSTSTAERHFYVAMRVDTVYGVVSVSSVITG